MTHLAAGLFILALTCATLVVASWVVPSMPDAGPTFTTGTVAALAASGALLYTVTR